MREGKRVMGQDTTVDFKHIDDEADEAIKAVESDALNGDPAHNALGRASIRQIHDSAFIKKKLMLLLQKASEVRKERVLKLGPLEIPMDVRDAPRIVIVLGVIYIIGKMHGVW